MTKTSTVLGHSELSINRIGLGCMGMSEFYGSFNHSESLKTLRSAVELGVNFFDTADMYGFGANERLLGEAFSGLRNKVVIATKFGVERGPNGEFLGLNTKPEYITKACEASLKNLKIDSIDLYYMHRQDPEIPIEDIVGAMKELLEQGKIRAIGLSEVDAATLRKAHQVHPISALQTEYSLWSRDPEGELFDTCRELGITFVAYSPLGRGFLTGNISKRSDLEEGDWRLSNPRFSDEAFENNQKFVEVVEQFAGELGATKAQVALAWILNQNDEICVIPGTRKIERLRENIAAYQVELSKEKMDELSSQLPKEAFGGRY